MNDLSKTVETSLPSLIDRAANALTDARQSAEVLEARDFARVAYDAAKSAGRMAKAKKAHEAVLGAVYRAQADALLIEARAKMRLADEYDAAQERGEVAKLGDNLPRVGERNAKATAAEIGLRGDEIHEARRLRDAEAQEPGKAEAALNQMVAGGEEPTKAKLRNHLLGEQEPKPKQPLTDDEKLRRKFRKMTPEGQEDDWVGLRLEVAEARARIKKQTGMIADLKARIKELSEGDRGATISRLQKRVEASNYARDEAMTKAKRSEYKMKVAQKRVAELENEEVEI